MKATLLSASAAVLLGLSMASAHAQEASPQGSSPYQATGAAPVCTQLELVHGIRGAECGKLSLTELARIKASRDNQ